VADRPLLYNKLN